MAWKSTPSCAHPRATRNKHGYNLKNCCTISLCRGAERRDKIFIRSNYRRRLRLSFSSINRAKSQRNPYQVMRQGWLGNKRSTEVKREKTARETKKDTRSRGEERRGEKRRESRGCRSTWDQRRSLKKYRRRMRLLASGPRRIRRNSICNAIALALYGDSIINPRYRER